MEIIKRPVITEKAMGMSHLRQYCFEVHPNANKIEIKKAIEQMFEVDITSIRTLRVKGKVKRRFTRSGIMKGKTNLRKKAYITLKEGQTIELVEAGNDND